LLYEHLIKDLFVDDQNPSLIMIVGNVSWSNCSVSGEIDVIASLQGNKKNQDKLRRTFAW